MQRLNDQLDRAMPLITPTSVIVGVLFADSFQAYSFLVPWIFAFMTFSGSLRSNFSSFKRTLSHPLPILLVLFILHIWMPLWAWGLGHLVFSGDHFTITGLLLATVIPTGITSLIWVSIHKGNVALTLCIILIDTFLSPFIVPYSLSILIGQSVMMDVWEMTKGLFGMIVFPSILGMILNQMTAGNIQKTLGPRLAVFSKIGVMAVIMINGAVISPYLVNLDRKLLTIVFVVLLLSSSGYAFSWFIGKFARLEKDEIIALTFTGGMRNISAGAVLAISYFEASIAVPVVIGILFQQVIASFYGYMLNRFYHRLECEECMQYKETEG
ncbi:bile acid:sodium symporter family protein [Bacillus sp. REN10]|uniref:bile acid:sodium symporter family protein n=1 Tax=Bacillus sp. REN10 TaxID=2782541 RepID=UPI00193B9E18|nr:bile acid:sodium symporter family protein [Bacillus sp. REN10]